MNASKARPASNVRGLLLLLLLLLLLSAALQTKPSSAAEGHSCAEGKQLRARVLKQLLQFGIL